MSAGLERDEQAGRGASVLRAGLVAIWVTASVLRTAHVVAAAPVSSGPAFDVLELRVLGNTTLAARDIETAVYPFTGPGKGMADVEAARAALERTYHDRGFGTVFVDIPEQSVDEGIVRLRVAEGRLNQVRVTGARYFSGREIRAAVPEAAPSTVPNLPRLQSELTALNAQTRDRTIIPVLKAGSEPGTVDLTLRVADTLPFHGSVELNNQYSADTSHLRAAAQASYDNLFDRLDSFSIQYQATPESPSESHVFATSYTARLGSDGSGLTFQYVDSKSDVATIGTLGVLGTGSVYGLRWSQPLPTQGSVQNVGLELDYKDFKQSIVVSPTSGLNTPIDYLTLSAAYSGARATNLLRTDWTASANFGIRGTPDNTAQFEDKRYLGEPDFFYVRSDGGVTLQLPARFSAALRITGQYAADPLISNEQLPIGGAGSVRGYLEAEELGDSVLRTSLQLGGPQLSFLSDHLQLNEFLFYDVARAFTLDPLPGQDRHTDLRSTGIGMTFDVLTHFYGSLTWAYPLDDGLRTDRGASTVLFVVRGYF
jgi:hemolysin activation/secretion protein